ncbi:MAG TPA: histidine kinase [Candidatus Angelobacter sp.]|nr:histidine kinase [Candidatus Angelobacter sp.]
MALPTLHLNWRSKPSPAGSAGPPCMEDLLTHAGLGQEHWLQAVIDALTPRVAVLDCDLSILAVNQTWRHFAVENGAGPAEAGVGASYFHFINQSPDRAASAAEPGLRKILEGEQESFCFDYVAVTVAGQRWFQLKAASVSDEGKKLLLACHEDVTERKTAQEAQREIDERILQAREEEQRRLARELHDSTVQKLFAVNLNLAGLRTLLEKSEKKAQNLLAETETLGRECMQELRSISYLLRPPVPDGHEFMPALCSYIDGFCKRSNIRINLVIPSHAGRMPSRVENALFRVVQESLSNVHRHSRSPSATVTLCKTDGNVVLEIKDQGKGIPGRAAWAAGGGLAGIQERLQELGGSLEIKPNHPGTAVVVTIPLKEDEAEAQERPDDRPATAA